MKVIEKFSTFAPCRLTTDRDNGIHQNVSIIRLYEGRPRYDGTDYDRDCRYRVDAGDWPMPLRPKILKDGEVVQSKRPEKMQRMADWMPLEHPKRAEFDGLPDS